MPSTSAQRTRRAASLRCPYTQLPNHCSGLMLGGKALRSMMSDSLHAGIHANHLLNEQLSLMMANVDAMPLGVLGPRTWVFFMKRVFSRICEAKCQTMHSRLRKQGPILSDGWPV